MTNVFLFSLNKEPALDAAPLAWATVSGMSFGPSATPAVNIPFTDVSVGESIFVFINPNLSNSMFNIFDSSIVDFGVSNPTDKTIKSKISETIFPESS